MTSPNFKAGSNFSKFSRFVRQWGATILFVLFIIAHVITITRLYDQNDRLEALVEDYTTQVQVNEAFVTRTLNEECAIRAEARLTVREIFFGILEQLEQTPRVRAIIDFIETDFPPIECFDVRDSNE